MNLQCLLSCSRKGENKQQVTHCEHIDLLLFADQQCTAFLRKSEMKNVCIMNEKKISSKDSKDIAPPAALLW